MLQRRLPDFLAKGLLKSRPRKPKLGQNAIHIDSLRRPLPHHLTARLTSGSAWFWKSDDPRCTTSIGPYCSSVRSAADLLIPHAFFYFIRGPRIDECPPQLGPHSPWWSRFNHYADRSRRLCRLNAEGTPIVRVAIAALSDHCPEHAARALYETQIDFHYIEERHLAADALVTADRVALAGFEYRALVVDTAAPMEVWSPEACAAVAALDADHLITIDQPAAPGLRARLLAWSQRIWLMLLNETEQAITTRVEVPIGRDWITVEQTDNAGHARGKGLEIDVQLAPGGFMLLCGQRR
jgi:hypothetical protein